MAFLISADAFFKAAVSLIAEVPRTIGKNSLITSYPAPYPATCIVPLYLYLGKLTFCSLFSKNIGSGVQMFDMALFYVLCYC